MKAPKCKICGNQHWGLCQKSDHHKPKAQASVTIGAKALLLAGKPVVAGDIPVGAIITLEPRNDGIHVIHIKPAFDRVAYQREYMRKRRAKLKEAKL